MVKGMAKNVWEPYVGCIPLILQTVIFSRDDVPLERTTAAKEALMLGAEAIEVSLAVRSKSEPAHLTTLAQTVDEAARYQLSVIAHLLPVQLHLCRQAERVHRP